MHLPLNRPFSPPLDRVANPVFSLVGVLRAAPAVVHQASLPLNLLDNHRGDLPPSQRGNLQGNQLVNPAKPRKVGLLDNRLAIHQTNLLEGKINCVTLCVLLKQ